MRIDWILGSALVWLAIVATAGTASGEGDVDGDLVPDAFDNCIEVPNGPGQAPNDQVDADGDGYGNACDADFDQSGFVGLTDYNILWTCFGRVGSCTNDAFFPALDLDVDGATNAIDQAILFTQLGNPFSASSGLACADPTLKTTLIGGTDPICN